jgi:Mce-associated membrane protein
MTLHTHDDIDVVEGVPVTDLEVAEATADAPENEPDETVEEAVEETVEEAGTPERRRNLGRILTYVVLPVVALAMALGVGYLKWQANGVEAKQSTAAQSVSAATEAATAMLSYRADHVEQDLTGASDRMTGGFRDEYTKLINDVVIPGAKDKRISAAATVPAAALVSASADRAEVLVYIDQTTTVGDDPPSSTMSSARVTLEKVGDRWLLSGFEPV